MQQTIFITNLVDDIIDMTPFALLVFLYKALRLFRERNGRLRNAYCVLIVPAYIRVERRSSR